MNKINSYFKRLINKIFDFLKWNKCDEIKFDKRGKIMFRNMMIKKDEG